MSKKTIVIAALVLAVSVLFAACDGKNDGKVSDKSSSNAVITTTQNISDTSENVSDMMTSASDFLSPGSSSGLTDAVTP